MTPSCPLQVIEWDHDDADQLVAQEPYRCGADLFVVWSFSCAFASGDIVDSEAVGKLAEASSWRVECANGHVLATSSNALTGGYDCAEPFVADLLFPPGEST